MGAIARTVRSSLALRRRSADLGLKSRPHRRLRRSRTLWRGLKGLFAPEMFMELGGTELGNMSCSADLRTAVRYTMSSDSRALIFMLRAETFMQLGADLSFLSCFPEEKEFLYPPLTFLRPTGKTYTLWHDGTQYTVVEMHPQFPG